MIQDKVNYLRVVLTRQCNLSCIYCHKEGVRESRCVMSPEFLVKIMRCFHEAGIRKFKMMGGEPTLYEPLPDILRGLNFPDSDVSMISNGLFDRKFLGLCFEAGLQRVNISVHAWSDENRMRASGMTRGMIETLRGNLQWLADSGRLSKVNYVLLKSGGHEELFDLIGWISRNNQTLDILNVISTDGKDLSGDFMTFGEIRSLLDERCSLAGVYVRKNPYSLDSLRLKLTDGGEINLKVYPLNSARSFESCKTCREISRCSEGIRAIRLTCGGYVQPCLIRSDNRLDIETWEKKSEDEITSLLADYIMEL